MSDFEQEKTPTEPSALVFVELLREQIEAANQAVTKKRAKAETPLRKIGRLIITGTSPYERDWSTWWQERRLESATRTVNALTEVLQSGNPDLVERLGLEFASAAGSTSIRMCLPSETREEPDSYMVSLNGTEWQNPTQVAKHAQGNHDLPHLMEGAELELISTRIHNLAS